MKNKILLITLIITNSILGQGESALLFSTFQQSPLLNGAGRIGTAVLNDDVTGYYLNPAILGFSAKQNHAAVSFMVKDTEWPNIYYPGTNSKTFGINLGYNLRSIYPKIPLTIGMGFIHHKFEYGTDINPMSPTASNGISYDKYNAFSIGLGYEHFLDFNLGISLKSYESVLGGPSHNSDFRDSPSADGIMFDFGTLINFPISKLYLKNTEFNLNNSLKILPSTQISLGYSLTNVGDELYYIDKTQSDPLSRTERIGYSFNFGFKLEYNNTLFNIIDYSFSGESEDLLIIRNRDYDSEYQSIFGDINLIDHLIKLKGDNKIIVHKGHIIDLFNTITFTFGSSSGSLNVASNKTNGYKISSEGLFNLLGLYSTNYLSYVFHHLRIEYIHSDIKIWTGDSIKNDFFSLHFIGFEI